MSYYFHMILYVFMSWYISFLYINWPIICLLSSMINPKSILKKYNIFLLTVWSVILVLFLLLIVFSVLPRFTDSDYTFGIFKLFLQKNMLCRGNICTHKKHTKRLISNLDTGTLIKCDGDKKEWQLLMCKHTKSSYFSEKFIIIKGTDKSHVISVRSHNQCHHKVKCWYTLHNTTYNTTYSDDSCGRFTNAISLTNAILLCPMPLKYSFTLKSNSIVL